MEKIRRRATSQNPRLRRSSNSLKNSEKPLQLKLGKAREGYRRWTLVIFVCLYFVLCVCACVLVVSFNFVVIQIPFFNRLFVVVVVFLCKRS